MDKDKAILFLTTYYPDPLLGGIERVTRLLAEHFAAEGRKVCCLHFRSSAYDGSYEVIESSRLVDIYDRAFVADYAKQRSVGLIINQSHFFYTPFLRTVADDVDCKLVTCLHSSTELRALPLRDAIREGGMLKRVAIVIGYPLYRLRSEHRLLRQHAASFAASDYTLLLSPSLVAPYRKKLDIDTADGRLCSITNPLSFAEGMSVEHLQLKEKIVLVVARLYENQKRLSLLLRSWAVVENNVASAGWRLVIVGEGEDYAMYRRMVRRLRLQRVTFEGAKPSRPYYERASVFAMTSVWEGLPMTLLESLQMGVVPVVMRSFDSLPDIVTDDVNGVTVPFGDTAAMASALIGLMTDSQRLHCYAKQCIERSRNFAMPIIARQWDALISRL